MRCHLPTGHSHWTRHCTWRRGRDNWLWEGKLLLQHRAVWWQMEAIWLRRRSPIVPLGTANRKPDSSWRCGWRPGRERPGFAASWKYLVGVIIYSSIRALAKKALHHRWNLLLELITLSPPSPPMMIFYSELITFYLLITVIMAHLQWVD